MFGMGIGTWLIFVDGFASLDWTAQVVVFLFMKASVRQTYQSTLISVYAFFSAWIESMCWTQHGKELVKGFFSVCL